MSLRYRPSREYYRALDRRLTRAFAVMTLTPQERWDIETFLRRPAHEGWTRHVRRSKSGKETQVWRPCEELQTLQSITLHAYLPPQSNEHVATAFRKGCSIIANAKPHRENRSSFRIDIQDAFPAIKTNHVSTYLYRHSVDEDVAWVLARLWTFRGRVEQGAPIAPTLFNAMLAQLDGSLLAALPDGFVYTRYGDDMCFSCPLDEFPTELEGAIKSIVEAHGFRINVRKTKRGRDGIVDLPGIVIKNGRIRPNGAYRKKIQDTWRFMLPKQTAGHRAYVSNFGHSGNLRVLRPLLNIPTPKRPRSKRKTGKPAPYDDIPF